MAIQCQISAHYFWQTFVYSFQRTKNKVFKNKNPMTQTSDLEPEGRADPKTTPIRMTFSPSTHHGVSHPEKGSS
jgi:hypothetical protein